MDTTGDTNSQGGYWIYGTDEYDDLVVATYWPDDGYWTLLNSGIIIDQFYVFYTDGSTVLAGSCYYQIEVATGDWSSCFTLYGEKTSSVSTSLTGASLIEATKSDQMKALKADRMRLIQADEETIDDSIKQKYWQLRRVIDSQK